MPTVSTTSGTLTGKKTHYGYAFLGVPFARAERFCAPETAQWEGILDCTQFGKKAFQVLDDLSQCSEDCLNLNIYTPDLHGNYPVVIDVHGGAFQNGSNSDPKKNPARFIEDARCVYIPIQYRLGVWGYLDLSEELGEAYKTSGNCGTLDQLAAIRWVSENIAHFGGDPKRITLMGNSAGAKAIGALLTIPQSKGLFQQILSMSGAPHCIRSHQTAREVTKRFLQLADCTPEELLTLPNEQLLKFQSQLCGEFSTCVFGPVSDGVVIPENWKEFLRTEDAWDGKAYLGTNRRENGNIPWETAHFFERLDEITFRLFGHHAHYAAEAFAALTAGKTLTEDEKREVWTKVLSDFMYRTHTDRLASLFAQRGMQVWQYSLEWLPAHHDTDRRFAWQELNWDKIPAEKRQAALHLSEQVYESFLSFICTGDPNGALLPPLKPVSETQRQKWMFGEKTTVKEWKPGESDVILSFPEEVYSLADSKSAAPPREKE